MAFKIKFNPSFFVKVNRIGELPKIANKIADAATKKDANGVIEEYKAGLRNETFGLQPLTESSQKAKSAKGYTGGPLVGAGESEKNSYINAWYVLKIDKGYEVALKKEKHHSSGLPLNILFQIHENGIRIKTANGGIITIPPRKTQQKAIKAWLAKRDRAGVISKVKDIIIQFLKTGSITGLVEFEK